MFIYGSDRLGGKMDINGFIEELDSLYTERRINDVEPFFNESIEQAKKENDLAAQFTILNEMMGFFRDTSQFEKSIKACNDCIELMKKMGIEGTVDYATSLQNVANAYRAAGKLAESLEVYKEVFSIYNENIPSDDYRMASLNNNIALLYQEMNDFPMAVQHLKKALSIIEKIEGMDIEVATTYTNLAASLIEINQVSQAEDYLKKALEIFDRDEVKNFHYSGALCAMASVKCSLKQYEEAVKLYEKALPEIEANMGRGSAYNITKENLAKVFDKIKEEKKELTGIELAKSFYEEYGKDMIRNSFSEYEDKIAVGFVGEGSERFGFDDVYSRDHDFGPGFCMWITEDVYEKIGEKLQDEYNKLPKSYKGITRVDTIMAEGRVGVCVVEDFYKKYTGSGDGNLTLEQWINLEDYKIATVTNGEVFRDDLGYFSKIREKFENQPFQARLVKLARQLGAMAQTGQSNYERAMARKDYVTAQICISDFMKETMKCVYILNNKFAPYYKWLFKGVSSLDGNEKIVSLLEKLSQLPAQKNAWDGYLYDNTKFNEKDEKAIIMEEIAKIIIDKLLELKLIKNRNSNFLNDYVRPIMDLAEGKVEMFDREKTIDKIVKLEFEAFDKVQNVGGRASCQNNWPFFYVMRKSQYMTWTDEMLECICNLWEENKAKGWNMITEKYGRMMEHTSPEEYEKIKDNFPEKSERTIAIVNQIAQIQVDWMKDFAKSYPKLASNARDITSDADQIDNTSYETYLKGELLTYSEELLKLYAQFIVNLAREGKNLAYMTIENTAHLQGYATLEDAESSIR